MIEITLSTPEMVEAVICGERVRHDRVAPIICADDEKRLVYGLVYAPETEDTHGEMADAETIEAAAHGFMESRMIGIQHEREAPAAIVESYIAQADQVIGGQHVSKGSWMG